MKFVKSEQSGRYSPIDIIDDKEHIVHLENETDILPEGGIVVGTYLLTDSGYCPIQNITYEELNVFLD